MAGAVRTGSRSGGIPIAWPLLLALRPRQWTKNGLIFVALAFTLNLQDVTLVVKAVQAFVCFCALSSAGYLLNDVMDVEADRQHPTKRLRPIAAGSVPIGLALGLGLVLAVVGLVGTLAINLPLGGLAVAYVALTALYSVSLKHVVLVDIFGLSAGFVLRAAAGAVAIDVPISPWLYIGTALVTLFLALGKRRHELSRLSGDAARHRPVLRKYNEPFLDQMISITTTACLVSSSTRSALITAPASAPAAAAAPTCAERSVTFPAAHTPGTSVRPAGSAGTCEPIPLGCSLGFSPRPARNPARAVIRAPTATACRGTTLPSASRTPVRRSSEITKADTSPSMTRMPRAASCAASASSSAVPCLK